MKNIGLKNLILSIGIAPLIAVGCTNFSDPDKNTTPQNSHENYITIGKGETIKNATMKLAEKYNLSLIEWGKGSDKILSNERIQIPFRVDVNSEDAQNAFDRIFSQTMFISDVSGNVVRIEPFNINKPNASYTVVYKPKPKRTTTAINTLPVVNTSPAVVSSQGSSAVTLNNSQLSNMNTVQNNNLALPTSMNKTAQVTAKSEQLKSSQAVTKTAEKVGQSADLTASFEGIWNNIDMNKNSVMTNDGRVTTTSTKKVKKVAATGKERKKLSMPETNAKEQFYKINPSESFRDNIRKAYGSHNYNLYWGNISKEMSEFLATKVGIDSLYNDETKKHYSASSLFEFTNEFIKVINKQYLKENEGKPLYSVIDNKTKTVILHQNRHANDVFIFQVKKGLLSANVANLAKEFGWTLNTEDGWLADNDYIVSVDYPLITEDSLEAAILKLIKPYTQIKPQLLESTKSVYIINNNQ